MTRTRTLLIGVVLVVSSQLMAAPEFKTDEVVLPSAVAGRSFEYDLHQLLKPVRASEPMEFALVYPPDFPTWLSITRQGMLYGRPALEAVGNYVFEIVANHRGERDSSHLSAMITVTDPTDGITPIDRVRP